MSSPAARRTGSVLLNVASVLGALCIIGVILTFVFHLSVILFATGSMTPTIPAGSAALVQQMPADQIKVGQIVTVDRSGELPITHRVYRIVGEHGATTSFRMKGDANAEPDPVVYRATSVRIVLGSIPGIAPAFVVFAKPYVMLAIALAAAILVTWAFWPRRHRARGRPVEGTP